MEHETYGKMATAAIVLWYGGTFNKLAVAQPLAVKAYQKMYLNDQDMALSARKVEVFETNFETYREGAAGANGGKVGGGCGCN
jgi:hypothetical protein